MRFTSALKHLIELSKEESTFYRRDPFCQ
jgi:hypothetical protein